MTNFGRPFRETKRVNARIKAGDVKSGTNSKCTALLEAHVTRRIYTFEVESLFSNERTVNGPQKSTPTLQKEKLSSTLKEGKSGVSGGEGVPWH